MKIIAKFINRSWLIENRKYFFTTFNLVKYLSHEVDVTGNVKKFYTLSPCLDSLPPTQNHELSVVPPDVKFDLPFCITIEAYALRLLMKLIQQHSSRSDIFMYFAK